MFKEKIAVRVVKITFDENANLVTVSFSDSLNATGINEWEMYLRFPFQPSGSNDFREDQIRATNEAMAIIRSLSERSFDDYCQ